MHIIKGKKWNDGSVRLDILTGQTYFSGRYYHHSRKKTSTKEYSRHHAYVNEDY